MIGIMTAAGKGTRMKALTGKDLPKVLLPINEKPVIAYGIESMQAMGIKKIYIVARKEYEVEFLELNQKYDGLKFLFIDETHHIMDSVEALANFILADESYNGENAVYWLADNIFVGETYKNALVKMDKRMELSRPSTGFLLVKTNTPQDFITKNLDNTFSEKPKNPETNVSATGVFLVNKEALKDTSRRIKNPNTAEFTVWDSWMAAHEIIFEEIDDVWIDVGTPERYLDIKRALESNE